MVSWEAHVNKTLRSVLKTLILYDVSTVYKTEFPVETLCFELNKPIYQKHEQYLQR
jgi:hypothetical protein